MSNAVRQHNILDYMVHRGTLVAGVNSLRDVMAVGASL